MHPNRRIPDRQRHERRLPHRRAGLPGRAGITCRQRQTQRSLQHRNPRRRLRQRQGRQQHEEPRRAANVGQCASGGPRHSPQFTPAQAQRGQPHEQDHEVRRLFGGQHQRRNRRRAEQIPPFAALQVSPQEDQQQRRPHRHQDVVAPEPAEVQQRRRKRQYHRGANRSFVANLPTQKIGQDHQRDAEQGVRQPGYKVRIAQDPQEYRHQLNLERPVHPRRVQKLHATRQFPSVVQVNRLVIVHHPPVQLPQPKTGGHQRDQQEPPLQPAKGGPPPSPWRQPTSHPGRHISQRANHLYPCEFRRPAARSKLRRLASVDGCSEPSASSRSPTFRRCNSSASR